MNSFEQFEKFKILFMKITQVVIIKMNVVY